MTMSSPYQPLLIRALIEAGGRSSAGDLANVLLLADSFAVDRARSTLMRWPKETLGRHGVATYDRASREFELKVDFAAEEERARVIDACTAAIDRWSKKEGPKVASRFFSVIERAGGRCEACGLLGSILPINVDHIVPKSQARAGKVRMADGDLVGVDDLRNLQALCARCNRGKRDTSTFDFRPTADRLAETVALVLKTARDQGFAVEELLARARSLM